MQASTNPSCEAPRANRQCSNIKDIFAPIHSQALTHRTYELSRPEVARVQPDGHRDVFAELEEALAVTSSVDFRITDKDGNVIADSKRDRVEKKKSLAELIASHRKDTLLASLLRSYSTAVHDPNDELVHLYEIREALCSKFKDRNATQTALDGHARIAWPATRPGATPRGAGVPGKTKAVRRR